MCRLCTDNATRKRQLHRQRRKVEAVSSTSTRRLQPRRRNRNVPTRNDLRKFRATMGKEPEQHRFRTHAAPRPPILAGTSRSDRNARRQRIRPHSQHLRVSLATHPIRGLEPLDMLLTVFFQTPPLLHPAPIKRKISPIK